MTQTVRVPLTGNILYVSGTVNGVETVWTQEEDGWWSTTAQRSTDGVYEVVLSIIYGSGQTVTDSVTLYYGLTLITDRTQSDVTNGTDKGLYNASDLNRVGAAMVYLRDKFNDNGYDVSIQPKTDWREIDVPTDSSMTLYLQCLGTLRGVLTVPDGTPETPVTMEGLNYITANNIEKILEAVDLVLNRSITFLYYSGELYSGEVV